MSAWVRLFRRLSMLLGFARVRREGGSCSWRRGRLERVFILIPIILTLPLNALTTLALLICSTNEAAATDVAPVVSNWKYNLCVEAGAYLSRGRIQCEVWYDGATVIYPSGSVCENSKGYIASEPELVPRAEAFEQNLRNACSLSSSWSGWLADGQTVESWNCWSGGPTYSHGIQTRNFADIPTSGLAPDSQGNCTSQWSELIRARKDRTVECPQGFLWSGDWCTNTGESLHKNNGYCSSNGVRNAAGNPIHVGMVFKFEQQTDIENDATELPFTRYYVSNDHWAYANLGVRWRHNYAYSLQLLRTGVYDNVTLLRPNGDRYFFSHNADGTWSTEADIQGALEEVGAGFTFRSNNDSVEEYDAHGNIVAITAIGSHKKLFSVRPETAV